MKMPFLQNKRKLQSNCRRLENLAHRTGLRRSVFSIHGDGDKYNGEWKESLPEGRGTYLSKSNKLYEGDWMKNYRHGVGIFSVTDDKKVLCLQYRGDWKLGHFSEFGTRHYPDGSYYSGFWKNSKRHGYGQMWNADGSFYDGDWCKNERHNLGMYVEPNGNRYEGEWSHNLKEGKGRYFHLDSGQMQEGIWRNDICVSSYFTDILFRQAAVTPTPYPIPIMGLVEADETTFEVRQEKGSKCVKIVL